MTKIPQAKCPKCHGTGLTIDNLALGLFMRQHRLKSRLSLRAVARRMGFSPPYLSDLELGRRRWKPELISAYNQALKV